MARRIRLGDLVQVVAGADRGKQGKVIGIHDGGRRVRVEKVRLQKHHLKPGRKLSRTGGILEHEGYIDASNVMLVNPADGKPSRLRSQESSGKRIRVFARGGEAVPDPAQG